MIPYSIIFRFCGWENFQKCLLGTGKIETSTHQISFHTAQALQMLRFMGEEKVSGKE